MEVAVSNQEAGSRPQLGYHLDQPRLSHQLDQPRLDTGSEADFRHVVEAVRYQSQRDSGDEFCMISETDAILEAERIIMAEVTKKVIGCVFSYYRAKVVQESIHL